MIDWKPIDDRAKTLPRVLLWQPPRETAWGGQQDGVMAIGSWYELYEKFLPEGVDGYEWDFTMDAPTLYAEIEEPR